MQTGSFVAGCLTMADLMVEGIAGAYKVVFPGVAHMIPMERPEEFNRVLLEFLR
jgi:3-oxoadipate enol-lactonase